jgi:hypothetical protein
MTKTAISVWKAAREYARAPECPSNMSEPHWAALLCEDVCEVRTISVSSQCSRHLPLDPPTELWREKRHEARFLTPASSLRNLQESKVSLLFRSLNALDFYFPSKLCDGIEIRNTIPRRRP